MLRHPARRRTLGAVLIVLGALALWAIASPVAGSVLFAAAIVLEVVGITLEHRATDRDTDARR